MVCFGYLSATVTYTLESTLRPHSAVNKGLNDLQEMQLLLIRPAGRCVRKRDITIHRMAFIVKVIKQRESETIRSEGISMANMCTNVVISNKVIKSV